MIPAEPKDVPINSLEDIMFEALKKLSDDYYVVHSFRIINIKEGVYSESEADFVIFHPKKGLLCIEAKAGKVSYRNGQWYYGSGRKMNDPFEQANKTKWKIKELFEKEKMNEYLDKCKLLHAVWFPSIRSNDILPIALPVNAHKSLILTKEAIDDPEYYLDKIFSIQIKKGLKTNLHEKEAQRIIRNIICPSFDLVISVNVKLDYNRYVFNKLLKEQANILNFLEEQPNAVINGVAGSGKTMIALEKARRHAERGERVLFLCFNKRLCDHFRENHKHHNIDYYTIDGFACRFCRSPIPNYELLLEKLFECYENRQFMYRHIIIDEGQDFGQKRYIDILEALEMLVIDNGFNEGTFYLFYDKNQLVQSFELPKYIAESDCKLTLYKNCRNTKNIAITSTRPLRIEQLPKVLDSSIDGPTPELYISKNRQKIIQYINQIIKKLLDDNVHDIVILTCQTEEESVLYPYIHDDYYEIFGKKICFTTSRKFKGLEADAIVLIDIMKKNLIEESNLVFYVGSSRARFYLYMVANLTTNDCYEIVESIGKQRKNRPERAVASYLNAVLREYDK